MKIGAVWSGGTARLSMSMPMPLSIIRCLVICASRASTEKTPTETTPPPPASTARREARSGEKTPGRRTGARADEDDRVARPLDVAVHVVLVEDVEREVDRLEDVAVGRAVDAEPARHDARERPREADELALQRGDDPRLVVPRRRLVLQHDLCPGKPFNFAST